MHHACANWGSSTLGAFISGRVVAAHFTHSIHVHVANVRMTTSCLVLGWSTNQSTHYPVLYMLWHTKSNARPELQLLEQ